MAEINPAQIQNLGGGGMLAGGATIPAGAAYLKELTAAYNLQLQEKRLKEQHERAMEEKMAPYNFLEGYYDAQKDEHLARAKLYNSQANNPWGTAGDDDKKPRDYGAPGPSHLARWFNNNPDVPAGITGGIGRGIGSGWEAVKRGAEHVGQSNLFQNTGKALSNIVFDEGQLAVRSQLQKLPDDKKRLYLEALTVPNHPHKERYSAMLAAAGVPEDIFIEELTKEVADRNKIKGSGAGW